MKWNRTAALAVIAILASSYAYSSIKGMELSNQVEEEEQAACMVQGRKDCALISKYHDDCFTASYRAERRIKTFHADEYNICMNSKITQHQTDARR